jgi:hypothetical protein
MYKMGFTFKLSCIAQRIVRPSGLKTMERTPVVSGPADPISSKVSRSKNFTVLSAEPAVYNTLICIREKKVGRPILPMGHYMFPQLRLILNFLEQLQDTLWFLKRTIWALCQRADPKTVDLYSAPICYD